MPIHVDAHLAFRFSCPTDVLLQIEAAAIPEQQLEGPGLSLSGIEHMARVAGTDMIGSRIWLRCNGAATADYATDVTISRAAPEIAALAPLPPHLLPGGTVQYLFDSRFCPAERFQPFVEAEFAELAGGTRIAAIRDWVARKFHYAPGASDAMTTALDSFVERRGVCRDFAHMVCTLARASGIPARYVSCFAPGVTPQDFHAVAEVFLADRGQGAEPSGSWHLVDATGMAGPSDLVKIAVGRDAADVSFLTSYGPAELVDKEIAVSYT